MITEDDIIRVGISLPELMRLKRYAERAEIGGRSCVRNSEDRQDKLRQDQLVGQLGTYCGIKALFGNSFLYSISRYYANIYRALGDGGSDVPGANIDFKSSLITGEGKMIDYRLAVRPRERHEGMNYILVLVGLDPAVAYLVGWAGEDMLPKTPETNGPFEGAFVLRGSQLNPLMKLRWFK